MHIVAGAFMSNWFKRNRQAGHQFKYFQLSLDAFNMKGSTLPIEERKSFSYKILSNDILHFLMANLSRKFLFSRAFDVIVLLF